MENKTEQVARAYPQLAAEPMPQRKLTGDDYLKIKAAAAMAPPAAELNPEVRAAEYSPDPRGMKRDPLDKYSDFSAAAVPEEHHHRGR